MPPVMYSQPWSPAPSTTATAPEFRTAKRSPARARAVELAARRAVEAGVPEQVRIAAHVRRRTTTRCDRRPSTCRRRRSPRRQGELDAGREERAEALPGAASEPRTDAAGGAASPKRYATSPPSRAPTARSAFAIAYGLDDARLLESRPRIRGETVSELAAGRVESRLMREAPPREARSPPSSNTSRAAAGGRCGRRRRRSSQAERGECPAPPRQREQVRDDRVGGALELRSQLGALRRRCRRGRCRDGRSVTSRQPSATSNAVPNETSSAPSNAATTTSRPVLRPPSTRTARGRQARGDAPLSLGAASSQGSPAFLMDDNGLAPVPPSAPAMCTTVGERLRHARGDHADARLGDELTETSACELTWRRSHSRKRKGDPDRDRRLVRQLGRCEIVALAVTEGGERGGEGRGAPSATCASRQLPALARRPAGRRVDDNPRPP